MTPEEIYQEWMDGESTGMRPKRVQQLREELMEITGLPIPRRPHEIENWMDTMRGHVTTKLKKAVEEGDPKASERPLEEDE